MHVTVLMSTYNGERFIKQQLDSIFNQKNINVRLVVRDDGSTDKTLDILNEYKESGNDLIIHEGENIKPCKSFLKLIGNYCDDDYFALADQDDIWDDNKLFIAIDKLQKCDSKKPALYYSNLRLVDENNIFFRNAHTTPFNTENKYSALAENRATGCTIVYNRRLAETVWEKKIENFTMHDAYLFVICSLLGNVCYDFEPHINYRQHAENVVGIKLKEKKFSNIKMHFLRFCDKGKHPRYDDAKIILDSFSEELNETDLKQIKKIVNYKKSIRNRLALLLDKDIVSLDLRHNIRLKFLILYGNF